MFYKQRELRRLWEIEIYNGDPEDPDVTTRTETVVTWSAVAAIRLCGGRAVKQPVAKCFVTWPDSENDPIYRINDTSGPTDEVITPTIAVEEQ